MSDETTEAPAPNVVVALSRVIRDLPAIGKDGRADPKQGGYAYRGIEDITKKAQPILAKHGVIFTPHRILDRQTVDIVVNGKPWTDEKMTVLWRVYGPGGREDFIEIETPAIGRDNSDKGANKCMTQAFKYALIPTLCISDAKDDGDAASYERDLPPAIPMASKRDVELFQACIEELEPEQRSEFLAWKADQGFPWPWPQAALDAMEAKLEEIVGAEGVPSEATTDQARPVAPSPDPSPEEPASVPTDSAGSSESPDALAPASSGDDLSQFSDAPFTFGAAE